MANQISLQPQVLDLSLYAGDGVSFRLICTDGSGDPKDITGAVKAWICVDRLSDDSPVAEFTADLVDAYLGIITLSLTGEQTQALIDASPGKFTGVWDVEWEPTDSEPRTLVQGKVECAADVTK